LLHYKVLIITITAIAAVAVVIFSLISRALPVDKSPLPNTYTSKALMLINDQNSAGGTLSSMLSSSGLSSLASLAGVSTSGGATYSKLAVYLCTTNDFLDAVVKQFDLLHRYKIIKPDAKEPPKSPLAQSRKALKSHLKAEIDEDSGVLSIAFTDTDPAFAQKVAHFCAQWLNDRFDSLNLDQNKLQKQNLDKSITNTYKQIEDLENQSLQLGRSLETNSFGAVSLEQERLSLELEAQKQIYTQLRTQDEVLKVTIASTTPVFQILQQADKPDQKSGPSRGLICIIVTFAAFFISVFISFVLNAVTNVKNDSEAMAKLQGRAQGKTEWLGSGL
jgi:uncharacterized protein involved in exopolysaccharide biosynthesis